MTAARLAPDCRPAPVTTTAARLAPDCRPAPVTTTAAPLYRGGSRQSSPRGPTTRYRAWRGRIAGGLRLAMAGTAHGGAATWQVEVVS
jgi:hypothetical protein